MSMPRTGPDLQRPLRAGLARLAKATGVDGTMGGLIGPGSQRLVITELHSMLTNTFSGTVVVPGAGMGGKALQLARPIAVNDYLHEAAISHQYDHQVQAEQIHGAFATPVRVGPHIRAVVYGTARNPQNLGDRVIGAANVVAAQLARDLIVEIEVSHRLEAIEQEQSRLVHSGLCSGKSEEIYQELKAIADTTSDLLVRDRLHLLCDRLSPPLEAYGTVGVPLTRREREILAQIALGRTNNEVAEHLSIMPTTVKSYLKNAMRKFGTRNRVETIAAARHAGFIR